MIVCILGKSGCGKSAVESKLCEHGFEKVISYTTRKIRNGEIDGKDYHFITKEQFETMVSEGKFQEYVIFADNYYGTLKLNEEKLLVCVLERKGYEEFKKHYSKVVGVYLNITVEEAERRAKKRDADSYNKEERERRNKEDAELFSNIKNSVDIVVDVQDKSIRSIAYEVICRVGQLTEQR